MKPNFYLGYLLLIVNTLFGQTPADSLHFVELQGKKQYYIDLGKGEPAIVFLTGLGVPMDDFIEIQKELSKTTRTFSYDRAGIGKSAALNNERNIETMSSELNEILIKAGFDKPFILVGHSMGGWLAHYFTSIYPQKVCGLILLDCPDIAFRWKRRLLRTEAEKIKFDSLPRPYYAEDSEFSPTLKSEFKHSRATDSALLAGKNFPSNIPITVIVSTQASADKYSKQDVSIKTQLAKAHLKEAPQTTIIYTAKSGHFIYDDEPRLVIKSIRLMLKKIQDKK